MKSKVLTAILIVALILMTVATVLLTLETNRLERALLESGGMVSYLMDYSQEVNHDLASVESDLARLDEEYQKLQDEKIQVVAEKNKIETQAGLYRDQKYYFADVLDWVGTRFGYSDIGQMVRAYALATGQEAPGNCDVISPDRYLRWTSTRSMMFVVTPEKMGWSPYTYWSIRENVVFGPEHRPDIGGYLGSRGYEFRYPLIVGTWPLQEVHTTLDVYELVVEESVQAPAQFVEMVDLDCGIAGYITISDDIDQTKTIYFTLGDFAANVKLKYDYEDVDQVVPLLTQAANIVIADLTNGW